MTVELQNGESTPAASPRGSEATTFARSLPSVPGEDHECLFVDERLLELVGLQFDLQL